MNTNQSSLQRDESTRSSRAPVFRPSVWGNFQVPRPETPTSSSHFSETMNQYTDSTSSADDSPTQPQGTSDYNNVPVSKYSSGGTEFSLMSLLLTMDPKKETLSSGRRASLSIADNSQLHGSSEDVLDPKMMKLLLESFGPTAVSSYSTEPS